MVVVVVAVVVVVVVVVDVVCEVLVDMLVLGMSLDGWIRAGFGTISIQVDTVTFPYCEPQSLTRGSHSQSS